MAEPIPEKQTSNGAFPLESTRPEKVVFIYHQPSRFERCHYSSLGQEERELFPYHTLSPQILLQSEFLHVLANKSSHIWGIELLRKQQCKLSCFYLCTWTISQQIRLLQPVPKAVYINEIQCIFWLSELRSAKDEKAAGKRNFSIYRVGRRPAELLVA